MLFVTQISSLYRRTGKHLIKAIRLQKHLIKKQWRRFFNRNKRHSSGIKWGSGLAPSKLPNLFSSYWFFFSSQLSTEKSFSHSSTLWFHWACVCELDNLHFLAPVWSSSFQVDWNYLSLKMDWNLCRKMVFFIGLCQRLCQFRPSCLTCHQAQKIPASKELLLDIYGLLRWGKTKPFCPGPLRELCRQGALHLCFNQWRRWTWMRIRMLKFISANSRRCQEVIGNSLP